MDTKGKISESIKGWKNDGGVNELTNKWMNGLKEGWINKSMNERENE